VSLEIETGDFAVLVGLPDRGKTTLLNMIGGLDTPSSGASGSRHGDRAHVRSTLSKRASYVSDSSSEFI